MIQGAVPFGRTKKANLHVLPCQEALAQSSSAILRQSLTRGHPRLPYCPWDKLLPTLLDYE
jgi:hypothetical protein